MGFEIDFLPVGESNGDAICIRYGSENAGYAIHVVDGGYADTGKTIIDHINTYYDSPRLIDHVVLSHTDADHVGGLLDVVSHFDIGNLWMNRPWLYAADTIGSFHQNFSIAGLEQAMRAAYPTVAELEQIANRKNIPIRNAFAGDRIGPFTVLAPTRERYISLIPQFSGTPTSYAVPMKGFLGKLAEAAKAVIHFLESWGGEKLEENPPAVTPTNESSVVQLGDFGEGTALLTADVGPIGLNEAADIAAHFGMLAPPGFVQVPHHGSRRNVTPSVLNRWLGEPVQEGITRGIAFCSVGSNKPEYPKKRVQNAFLRRGYGVISTRENWKSHYRGLPPKPGAIVVYPEPFVHSYRE